MSITIHQAIERISLSLFNSKVLHEKAIKRGFVEAAEEHKRYMEAEQMAIDALREKAEREEPKPLTIEELLHMHGEPVYVTVPGKPQRNKWCIVNLTGPRPTLFCDEYTGDLFLVSGSAAKIYRHKPKGDAK